MCIPVSDKLKIYREMRNMTQRELSDKSGINLSTIKKYETNLLNPKPNQLKKLADALGVSVYMFMDFDVTTLGDAMALLMKIFDAVPVKFDIEKAKAYHGNKDNLPLIFDNPELNNLLYRYLNAQLSTAVLHDHPEISTDKIDFHTALTNSELLKLEMGLFNQKL